MAIVSGGAGLGTPEKFKVLKEFAQLLGDNIRARFRKGQISF